MRVEGQKVESPHIMARTAWLLEIGQQLRDEYTAVAQPEPMPRRLAALLSQLEASERRPPDPAAVRSATSEAVSGASVDHAPPAVPIASQEPSRARHHRRSARLLPEIAERSHLAAAFGSFEKLILDLLDDHLRGSEREAALRKFVAYVRVCYAAFESGLIDESELDSLSS
jgi:hypothetical protein